MVSDNKAASMFFLRGAHQPQELLLPLLVAQVRRLPAAGAIGGGRSLEAVLALGLPGGAHGRAG